MPIYGQKMVAVHDRYRWRTRFPPNPQPLPPVKRGRGAMQNVGIDQFVKNIQKISVTKPVGPYYGAAVPSGVAPAASDGIVVSPLPLLPLLLSLPLPPLPPPPRAANCAAWSMRRVSQCPPPSKASVSNRPLYH